MPPETISQFQETMWDYYAHRARHDLPWRQPGSDGSFDPYRIMVSEIMLQQTQVRRVIPKFNEFMATFPGIETLAGAPLGDVLRMWSGLGYNRRAKFLWQAAGMLQSDLGGRFPRSPEGLAVLPGIGIHTAGAILAYSFNQPVVFIETNIRTVVLFHFFPNEERVTDKQIAEVVTKTLPERGLTREWYWAFMDYGSHLKQTVGNLSRASAGYTRQGRFEGSSRQVRGAVLRLLGDGPQSPEGIRAVITDERLPVILTGLLHDELIHEKDGKFVLGV